MHKVRIDRRWLPLNALRAFEAVARHRSFTAAANSLQIAQSALSRHVISIEKLIGVQLFERRPHALVLTKAGQHLLPAVTKAFDRLEHSLEEIHDSGLAPLRTLRVQMPPTFAVHAAVPALREFRRANSEIEIDLVSPHGAGAPPSDVDVAVVYSKPVLSEYVSDLLWPVRLSILCHPDVAARHTGKELGAFVNDNEIVHVRIADLPRHQMWSLLCQEQGLGGGCDRGLVFDTALLAVQYVLSGEGLALVDFDMFADDLRSGRLVRPFDVTVQDGYGYYLVTHPDALSDTAVSLFRSWLIEHFGIKRSNEERRMRIAVSNE